MTLANLICYDDKIDAWNKRKYIYNKYPVVVRWVTVSLMLKCQRKHDTQFRIEEIHHYLYCTERKTAASRD